ncbi:MAG: preprotein translocase subunit SecY [Nanoarchaeota archaeon]|nr:preprotein translocase subunit SecY [Nanoarchaeota archaeon]
MSLYKAIITHLPEVRGPTQRKLSFKEKLKWTLIILVLFFILGTISLFGLDPAYQFRFEQLGIILGASFGTITSLGIGPIVTASIVLQLLNGSGIVKFDLTTTEGKKSFQGTQKLLAIFFVIFEACIYVFMGGFSPNPAIAGTSFFTLQLVLIGQLFLGGMIILFMDEVVQKWGFGSGISLFIVANVAQEILIQSISPLDAGGNWAFGTGQPPVGKIFALFVHLARNQGDAALLAGSALFFTVVVFVMAVYFQSMKVEIPLSFGRVRGYGMRWPLRFMYTSNIPVILVAALLANIQLWGQLMENWAVKSGNAIVNWISIHVVGQVTTPDAGHGIIQYAQAPELVQNLLAGNFAFAQLKFAFGYIVLMVIGAIIFSYFWMQTSGQDAHSVSKQIMSSGLQIPGFRKDIRILERILNRYITPLTIMGGLAVGVLAATADLTGALSRGTGILLAVMIIYQLYEEIAKHHMMDMHPAMRKFMER